MHACASGIERKLADRYAHATGALIAEAKNALAVAHDDRFDIVKSWIAEDVANTILQRKAKPRGLRKIRLNC